MPEPIAKRLDSGYWHVRWSAERWVQWPCEREPAADDVFGGLADGETRESVAVAALSALREKPDG